jgi:hypothetical protein
MTPERPEHRPDTLLAGPRTRRQAFKAALAGLSLTLPLGALRAAPAHAQAGDCTSGCFWTADRKFNQRDFRRCEVSYYAAVPIMLLFPPTLLGVGLESQRCADRAVLVHKSRILDCVAPGCSGFNPRAEYGPCETCPGDHHCCPCASVDGGYICCFFTCDDPDHHGCCA